MNLLPEEQFLQSAEPAWFGKTVAARAISFMAATLGIGSFLGLVNLAVGVLSALWLVMQLYGYFRYELPLKRCRLERARREYEMGMTKPDVSELGE